MPPNIKFPALGGLMLSDEQELMDAARRNNGRSETPPPPLNMDITPEDDDETFLFHDIEENAEAPAPPPSPDSHEPNNEHDSPTNHGVTTGHHDHHQQHHQRVINHLASQIMDPEELSIDDRRLSRAVRDAGEFSYGVIACEVWLLDEDDNRLVCPQGGWWHNSKLCQNNANGSLLDELETTQHAPVYLGLISLVFCGQRLPVMAREVVHWLHDPGPGPLLYK